MTVGCGCRTLRAMSKQHYFLAGPDRRGGAHRRSQRSRRPVGQSLIAAESRTTRGVRSVCTCKHASACRADECWESSSSFRCRAIDWAGGRRLASASALPCYCTLPHTNESPYGLAVPPRGTQELFQNAGPNPAGLGLAPTSVTPRHLRRAESVAILLYLPPARSAPRRTPG
jgi:hypothetical protein